MYITRTRVQVDTDIYQSQVVSPFIVRSSCEIRPVGIWLMGTVQYSTCFYMYEYKVFSGLVFISDTQWLVNWEG